MTALRPCSAEDGERQQKTPLNRLQLRDSETAKFVAALVPQIVKTIGTKLLALLPNLADQQHAARLVQGFFWKDLIDPAR